MNQATFISLAVKHLYRSKTRLKSIEEFGLNRELQYLLCCCFSRLEKTLGNNNITEKDVCLLVESWILAQGTEGDDALLPKDLPLNVPQRNP